MQIKHIFITLIYMSLVVSIWADNILDIQSVKRVEFNLKPNQTLIIDHKHGVLLGIMEVTPNNTIKHLPIPEELLGKNETDIMGKTTADAYQRDDSYFGDEQITIYRAKVQSPKLNEIGIEKPNEVIKKREKDFEWDKTKIIYDREEEILDIIR